MKSPKPLSQKATMVVLWRHSLHIGAPRLVRHRAHVLRPLASSTEYRCNNDEATINMGIHHEPREVPAKVPKQADMRAKV